MLELLLSSDRVLQELDAYEQFLRLEVFVAKDCQYDGSDTEDPLKARLLYVDRGHPIEAGVFFSHSQWESVGVFRDRLGVEVDGADPPSSVEALDQVPDCKQYEQEHDDEDDSLPGQPEA